MKKNKSFSLEPKNEQRGRFADWWHFIAHNKKWWLLPVGLMLLLLFFLAMIDGSATAPFIYTH
jgi:Family of unknown function (DUF5989)